MTLAVLTLAHGRHDHLRGQVAGLAASRCRPDLHVVAAMDDDDLAQGRVEGITGPWRSVRVPLGPDPGGLPLARARNAAAAAALAHGADTLVFLDVDCIPGPDTLGRYAAAVTAPAAGPGGSPARPALFCGDVAYLPPRRPGADGYPLEQLGRLGQHRPDRVRPGPGELVPEPDLRRFWSLSFALSGEDFVRTGGFCTLYRGYGGEDTDFAQVVRRQGGSLTWVGGATAYHQHHPSTTPPVQHLDAVVRNAGVFARRWGWWPMEGWLEAFADQGLTRRTPDGQWEVVR